MDKLKTRLLFISLIMLALVSVSAVAAADVDDVVVDAQDDFDLSEEIVTDVEDTSDDAQDVASVVPKSNSQDVLKADDDEELEPTVIAFYHLKSSGWVNETRTPSGAGSNGNWLKKNNTNPNVYGYPGNLTYQGRFYDLIYWTGPVNDDHPDGIYQIGDRVYYEENAGLMQFIAVYAVSPSEVTINWEMQSPDGVVKETETQTLSEDAPYTITMDDFDAKIAPYKSFNVGTGEDTKHYEFDHWEDADGNEITEDQVLSFIGTDYSVKYKAMYTVTVPTSNVTVIFIKKDENGDVISNESNVLEPGMTWTINSTTFENQISNYKEFDLNNVHYDFTHWEDEDGNEVTGPQTFEWTGDNYTKTYIAKYEGIAPAHVTVIFNNMSVEGAVSTNESNDIYQGMTWTINMTAFDNKIANYRNFTYNGKFYNFTHWVDEDGNEVTEPQTFEWADHNYTVTYTAVYEEFSLSNVTLIFTNMSYDGDKVTTNESNVLEPGVSWTIDQAKFDNEIANYREFTHEGVHYEFVQWVDEEGNPVSLPQTFEWTGEDQTYTYTAQYKLTKPSNVTVVFNKMSSDGPVSSNISNVIAIEDTWTILKAKFDNQIYGFTDFYYEGAHYVFNHWENETNDEVTEQTFEWTGEDYTRTMTAIYDIYPDCNITVIWDMMSSDGAVSTNDSKIVRHPGNWTVKMNTFDSQLPEKEFHYNGVYYIFNHWEDEEGNEVTEDQVLPWAEENYTVTYKAIYDEYPDIVVNVIWDNITTSHGNIISGMMRTVRYNTNFTVTMDTFDSKLPEKEFNYSGSHYVFKHWVDEDGNEVTEDQVFPWQPESYTRTYYAVYDVTLILETSVSNESASDKPGKPVTVDFTVNDENGDPVPNGTLTVTVDGTEYSVNVTDGKATFENIVLPDTPGEYLYDVTYSGTDYYYPSVGQLNLTVQKVDVIVTLPEVINYTGSVVDIVVDVVDEFGKIVNEGTITLTIDWGTKLSEKLMATAETHTAEVINGKATFNGITLGDPGTYPSKAEYSGTDYYNEAENESDVVSLPLDTTTSGDDVSGKAGDKKDITVDIVDQNGKPVKNGTAVLKVNGKEYTAEVVDGKATFKNVELPEKSTDATVEYLGNDYYNPSNTTIKITIIPDEIVPDDNTTDEPVTPTAEKAVPVIPAAGNPLALAVLALLTLVSTVSLGKK